MKAVIAFLFLLLTGCNSETDSSTNTDQSAKNYTVDEALNLALTKYSHTATNLSLNDGYPRVVENGRWRAIANEDWTDGFYPGILWMLSELDPEMESRAEKWTIPLTSRTSFGGHDIGFIINNSFGKAYNTTGKHEYLEVIKTGAINLSARYSSAVGAIRSWDFGRYKYPVIIDNLMNLELLFNASTLIVVPEWHEQAVSHAFKTLDNHVRSDFSSFHLVDYNPSNGEAIFRGTVQGAANDSTWARGQAWGIYGFAMIYEMTGLSEFEVTSYQMAKYFMQNLPSDNVPFWDLNLNNQNEPRDSSAAAIAAAGMLRLSHNTQSKEQQDQLTEWAQLLTYSLLTSEYLNSDPKYPALLVAATGNKPANREINTSLIYADYYFIEALLIQTPK
ncbi:glycoside hydrolase family 88 protein [Alteromonas facilis]|uniref:glycoside hydrolase family 88 protein n=1 Tax=Alteromonas facilis TaxID=2048004 RepID=UPI000C287EC9|nr:glycoside hydrolase family 88 protein [Alteromonas facilis]